MRNADELFATLAGINSEFIMLLQFRDEASMIAREGFPEGRRRASELSRKAAMLSKRSSELNSDVARALEMLPKSERWIITESRIKGRGIPDIAAELGMSCAETAMRLRNALDSMWRFIPDGTRD